MHYNYLKNWVLENKKTGLAFKDIMKFEDQYLLMFKNSKESLQICFSSSDQFLFFTDSYEEFQYEKEGELISFFTHLNHSKLNQISIDDHDRIITLHFEKYNIYNTLDQIELIIEIIPKYQNIILCKEKDGKWVILDSLKKISFAENNSRQILPGLEYQKPDTSYVTQELIFDYPLFIHQTKITQESDNANAFYEMNKLFHSLYYDHILEKSLNAVKRQLIQQINKQIKKKHDKISKLTEELFSEETAIDFKKRGELLLAFMNQIPENVDSVVLNDYYLEDNPPIEIKLDKKQSLKYNVSQYFKKYKKAQSGRVKVEEQLTLCQQEIEALKREQERIELINSYNEVKETKIQTHSKEQTNSMYRKLKINDDWEINIGRSNTENDQLTCKTARPDDWWFHTRIFRGTHVVLRNFKKQQVPDKLLLLCARLAAWYSKAKTSSNVPVDYTLIRYVRKPRGAAKGFVTYTKQKTIYVDPISIRDAAELIQKGEL